MQNELQQTAKDEMSLKDVAEFLKRSRKLIMIGGVVGLLLSTAYVMNKPKSYEAYWQVQMALFVNSNIEEPAALIRRLRMPTVYPAQVKKSCGVLEDGDIGDFLDGVLKVDLVKNVPNAVELRARVSSQSQAVKCAESVTAMILAQQRELIEERLAGRHVQLLGYQKALDYEQQQLDKIKPPAQSNFGYLAKLDRLSWLRTRIDALEEEAMLSRRTSVKLVAPIYAPSKPVAPRVKLVLLLGGVLGLMFGVLISFGQEVWRKML